MVVVVVVVDVVVAMFAAAAVDVVAVDTALVVPGDPVRLVATLVASSFVLHVPELRVLTS